jgi:uncharacterized membrane protein YczE
MFTLLSLSGTIAFGTRLAALIGTVSAINNPLHDARPPQRYWSQLDQAIVRFAQKLLSLVALVLAAELRCGAVVFADLSGLLQSSELCSRLINPALEAGSEISCQMNCNRDREIAVRCIRSP